MQNLHSSLEDGLGLGSLTATDATAILSAESGLGSISGEGSDFLGPLPPLPLGLGAGAGFGNMGNLSALLERSASRNSYSPAMSDSGISMDNNSNGSAGGLNLGNMPGAMADLAKYGGLNMNGQGGLNLGQQGLAGLGNLNSLLGLSGLGNTTRVMTPTTPEPSMSYDKLN